VRRRETVFNETVLTLVFINSIGQRLALLEEKLVVALVLRRFRVQATQAFKEVKLCSELILRPKEGIFVALTER